MFELAGTTGNVYYVTVKQIHVVLVRIAYSGRICKHVIYVLRLVLEFPAELECQEAFLIFGLGQIFEDGKVNRRAVDGDCAVCFLGFEDDEDIVWCRAECGNNIHRECFKR